MIPNLERCTAVYISGTWIVVTGAEPAEEGWITLHLPSYIKISARAESIDAIKYQDLPTDQGEAQFYTPWAGQ